MAVGISNTELDSYRFPNAALNHCLIKLYPLRLAARKCAACLDWTTFDPSTNLSIEFLPNLEASALHFKKHGWAFVENIFSQEVHAVLVKQRPRFYHFNPVRNIYKSYDTQFNNPEKLFRTRPAIKQLADYLSSDGLAERLESYFPSATTNRSMGKVSFSRARFQSSCVNHLDSVSGSEINRGTAINLIAFIHGTGGKRSGGTCIYADEHGDVVFEPTNTTNSLLIYRSDILYHGFRPMKFGSFRWMASCHAQAGRETVATK